MQIRCTSALSVSILRPTAGAAPKSSAIGRLTIFFAHAKIDEADPAWLEKDRRAEREASVTDLERVEEMAILVELPATRRIRQETQGEDVVARPERGIREDELDAAARHRVNAKRRGGETLAGFIGPDELRVPLHDRFEIGQSVHR